ncbi:MAG: hypothetical protein P8Q87_05160, partial [Candidatus Poseidonia sp.]|nr:hypothetical protein [Poseidonia sp.]
MGFARTVVAVMFLCVLGFYLSSVGELTDEAKWGSVALMGILAFGWINLGTVPQKSVAAPQPRSESLAEPESEVELEIEVEQDDGIPEPVRVESLDGATLRERKLAKIAAAASAQSESSVDDNGDSNELEITVELDDVHTAGEYVVEVSPESVEDADIELTVSDRRKRHEEIRQRIKQRRRGQMADIRASTAKMWEDHAAGEDLVALLQTPGHGHSVMVQPEHPAPGHVYGATFVRIDEGRILKLRLPLDDGFESIIKPKPEPQSELPELIGADGKILPPLMGAD